MKFKVIVEGRTKQELHDNIREYLGLDKEPCATQPPEQEKSLTVEAERPELPKTLASEVAPPTLPIAVAQPVEPSKPTQHSNDYGVDNRGLPWDERIHSVTQSKNKDGSWRTRRGVEDSTINQVEAELATKARELQSAGIPIVSRVDSQPVPAAAPSPFGAPQAPVAIAPVIPIPQPQPVVPAAHSVKTFRDTLIPTLAKLVRDGKLNQEYVQTLEKHFGVAELWKVNDQQLEELFNNFVQYGLIVKAQ